MSRHPRRDTGPEMVLRRILHSAGMRYRVQLRVPGMSRRTIDIAFTRWKLAVFVDGCFWHGCREHRSVPVANSEFWRTKIDGNVARDADTDRHLSGLGWVVIRVWEHESGQVAAQRIDAVLDQLRQAAVPPARRRHRAEVVS